MGSRKKQPSWAKLDNTALLFPVISGEDMSSTYRICATLKEPVRRELLQEAEEKVLSQFETFRMRLRMGFFWYYFEENDRKAPEVQEESDYPGAYINKSRNNQYMFRVTYYRNRINLEVFHALTDGFGGFVFLKELVYQYLRLAHSEELAGEKLAEIDYVELYSFPALQELAKVDRPALLAIAVKIGKTRLIDNVILGSER